MKFVVLFLAGLCAVTANASSIIVPKLELIKFEPLNIASYGLADETDEFLNENVAEYNMVMDKYNKLADEIQKEIDQALEEAEKELQQAIDKTNHDILKLKSRGGVDSINAALVYETELNEAKELALRGIKECLQGVLKAFAEFTKEVGKNTAELAGNIIRLKNLVLECYNQDGTINTIKCAFKNIRAVKDLIVKIVQGVKKLVESFITQGKNIIQSIKDCKENKVFVTLHKIHKIQSKFTNIYRI